MRPGHRTASALKPTLPDHSKRKAGGTCLRPFHSVGFAYWMVTVKFVDVVIEAVTLSVAVTVTV